MANSLIPYSFVPGTKAMASEVNANFIALAKIVDEGKTFTTEAIEEYNKEFESRLEESLGSKIETDLSNCCNITNCITEIPQRIKLELNEDGNITLKAGSVVTVPNGFEEDGVTRKFDYVTIENDISHDTGFTGSNSDGYICYNSESGTLGNFARMSIESASGITRPTFKTHYGYWYDLKNNIISYCYNDVWDTETKYSLPLCICSNTPLIVTSIDQIFNGFGYIGTCTWVDKGVKAFFADGRNPDGSMKKLECEYSRCTVYNLEEESSVECYLNYTSGILGYGVYSYFVQSTEPTNWGSKSARWFNTASNLSFRTIDGGVTWMRDYSIYLGKLTKTAGDNPITYLEQPQVVELLKRNDISNYLQKSGISAFVTSSYKSGVNWYRIWSDGWIEQGGRGGGSYTRTFLKPFKDTNYTIMVVPLSGDGSNDNCMVSSISKTGFSAYVETNNSGFWYACGY